MIFFGWGRAPVDEKGPTDPIEQTFCPIGAMAIVKLRHWKTNAREIMTQELFERNSESSKRGFDGPRASWFLIDCVHRGPSAALLKAPRN
jgi:hypothetical protein